MRQLLSLLFLISLPCIAQTSHRDSVRELRHQQLVQLDQLLAERRNNGSFDTNYIQRPRQPFTFKVRSNISGSSFNVKGAIRDTDIKTKLSADHKVTFSLGVNYRGITAGIALNPASLSGRNKDYEVNLNAYSNRYGFDVVYQMSKSFTGTTHFGETDYIMGKGVVDMKMITVNGYYAFNGRRFSYPAAFSQSYIQRSSAGSWLVGFSYLGGRLKAGEKAREALINNRVYVGYFGLGGGYGYNLVVRRKWLFHLSALPTVVVNNLNNVKIDGERRDMRTNFPSLILAERAAIVRTFNDKYFAGATMIMTNSLLDDNQLDINYRKWRMRLFFGWRL